MSKDIREIMKKYTEEKTSLSANHRSKFELRLQKEVHRQKSSKGIYYWLQIAATIVLMLSVGLGYYSSNTSGPIDPQTKDISLGSLSPELKSIESYYVNSINYEISQLDLNENNKEILDGYLSKINELTTEYKSLTAELNKKGVNDRIINALINNLQLRLQLLQRMKKQLNELKQLNSKQNEIQQT